MPRSTPMSGTPSQATLPGSRASPHPSEIMKGMDLESAKVHIPRFMTAVAVLEAQLAEAWATARNSQEDLQVSISCSWP